jgi:hypothetical protein
VTLHSLVAFVGCLVGFAAPAPGPRAAGSRGGGGGSQPGIARPDPERGSAEAIDLGEPVSIIATAIQEDEAEGGDGAAAAVPAAAPAGGAVTAAPAASACPLRRCFGAWCPARACGARAAAAAAAAGAPPAAAAAAAGPAGRGPDPLVGLLAACGALLTMAAAARAVALYDGALWADDAPLLLLQALPELLSALALAVPPHLMARVGMASRYARWQPRKGKPATSRPKNSNPAIWKRAGLPAPESRTQTLSEGV